MPFYEYECPSCKFYTEVLQKISDKPLKKCPSCGKTGFKRLVSAPVFRLKGSGWYETDFKSDKEGQRNLAGAEREEAAPADAKAKGDDKATPKAGDAKAGESKADSKSDAKAESKPGKHKPATPRATSKRSAGRGAKRPARPAKRGKGRR